MPIRFVVRSAVNDIRNNLHNNNLRNNPLMDEAMQYGLLL